MKGQENETQTVVGVVHLNQKPWTDILISSQSVLKLKAAEIRLNAPLADLMSRWVVDEKVPMRTICLKLDVALTVLDKLIPHFGLDKQVAANKLEYTKSSALRNMIIKKSQREQWAYR